MSIDAAAIAIPERVKDRRGWAEDIIAALDAIGQTPAREPVCAVVAVIEQESGFVADPAVANLAAIVDRKLDELADRFGPLGRPALNRLLAATPAGQTESFATRLKKVKTERDLDIVFRDFIHYFRTTYPRTTATAELASSIFAGKDAEDFNPITTAGSMQVSVRFAIDTARDRQLSAEAVRDLLYTRRGGVAFGTARLFGYEASYEQLLYRFADYNAGMYASRNAAVQGQLGTLTGRPLALDGDLLAYDPHGEPRDIETQSLAALLAFRGAFAPELSEHTLRHDARKEKRFDFEATETYRAIKRAFQSRQGTAPVYARIPDVTLQSPKLSRPRTTAWFADSVNRRWRACLARLAGAAR